MATNFSPCKGSYVLNQFPSNVMFGMNGFHVSASEAIQGHHGPLVFRNVIGKEMSSLSGGNISAFTVNISMPKIRNYIYILLRTRRN